MRFSILVYLMIFLFSGCAVKTPYVVEYKIDYAAEKSTVMDSQCKEKSVKIIQAFSSPLFRSQKMSYVIGNYEVANYNESQWVLSPNKAITMKIENMLESSHIFKTVQSAKSRAKTDFVIETDIEDFLQYFSEDNKKSVVKVKISMTLIEYATSNIVASETFTQEMKVEQLNALGGVNALNKTLNELLQKANIWLVKVCK